MPVDCETKEVEGPAAVVVAPKDVGQGVESASGGRGCCASERKEQGTSRVDIFPGVMGAEVGESGYEEPSASESSISMHSI